MDRDILSLFDVIIQPTGDFSAYRKVTDKILDSAFILQLCPRWINTIKKHRPRLY
jgi:hypothetical protein